MIGRYSDQMTYEYILGRMLDRVPNTIDKREGSIIYDALAPVAVEITKAYMELDVIMDETFVDTASLQYLMLRCKERGVKIKEQTYAIIEGTFTPSSLQLTSDMCFSCDDINYVIKEKLSDGVYSLQAQTLGTSGNKHSGFLLPVQIINGLETAQITDLIIPAEDADTTETLREKYYASIDTNAFGGNISDYEQKVKQIQGVGGVKVYPAWNGGGTVKLVIIASDYNAPSDELIKKIQTDIDPETNHGEGLGIAPIGHSVTVEGVTDFFIDVKTNITFSSGWDWQNAKSLIENAVNDYLLELAKSWEQTENLIVRIAQIENHILNLDCVIDIADTTLNGEAKNLQVTQNTIPKLKTIGDLI